MLGDLGCGFANTRALRVWLRTACFYFTGGWKDSRQICRKEVLRTLLRCHVDMQELSQENMSLIRRQQPKVLDQGIPALRAYLGLKILRRPNTWLSFVYNSRLYVMLADVVIHPRSDRKYHRTMRRTTEYEIMTSAIDSQEGEYDLRARDLGRSLMVDTVYPRMRLSPPMVSAVICMMHLRFTYHRKKTWIRLHNLGLI